MRRIAFAGLVFVSSFAFAVTLPVSKREFDLAPVIELSKLSLDEYTKRLASEGIRVLVFDDQHKIIQGVINSEERRALEAHMDHLFVDDEYVNIRGGYIRKGLVLEPGTMKATAPTILLRTTAGTWTRVHEYLHLKIGAIPVKNLPSQDELQKCMYETRAELETFGPDAVAIAKLNGERALKFKKAFEKEADGFYCVALDGVAKKIEEIDVHVTMYENHLHDEGDINDLLACAYHVGALRDFIRKVADRGKRLEAYKEELTPETFKTYEKIASLSKTVPPLTKAVYDNAKRLLTPEEFEFWTQQDLVQDGIFR